MQNKLLTILGITMLTIYVSYCTACKKFLDEKPNSRLAIPSTIKDFQAMMDHYNVMSSNNPTAGEISADNYYLATADWQALTENYRLMYAWEPGNLFPETNTDWYFTYRTVLIANTILENGQKLLASSELDNVLGQAYYWRAFSHQKIAFIWALAYDSATARKDLGIPLRLNTNFNETSVRSSVQETYDQIIDDLKKAIDLLPVTPLHVLRPSKPAALALLARTYLAMRNYDSVYKYADLALQLRNNPQDYNDPVIVASATNPFSTIKYNNADILFATAGAPTNLLSSTRGRIDSILYQSYQNNDLRKTVFFRLIATGVYGFKGSYDGGTNLFGGITVSETLLMRAEAAARRGNKDQALADLNALLVKRYKIGTFQQITAPTSAAALEIILIERRKELVHRNLRWIDIKRLNKEGRNINIKRILNGNSYELKAGSNLFALPLPDDVIAISGMQQNPR